MTLLRSPNRRARQIRAFPQAPAASIPAGRSLACAARCSAATIAGPRRGRGSSTRSPKRRRCSSSPPTTAWPSCPPPIRARWRWRCGRCSARVASTCSPGRPSAKIGSPTSSSSSSLTDVRAFVAPYGELPDLARPISTATWCLRGTGRHRACACPTPIGSEATGRGSPFATRPRRCSRKRSIGRSSMPRPIPGRRCWGARRSTAC